ncbi:MAG: HlyD family efflux transporter periplasmic adaptor subunit [Lachnospiraceae bacterium]|nr:HlyD family efflux transporter periplasmic adaptor subunit [Lachnospiraceae bacterium]
MNENTTKRREWVKNVAIVFLSVMLVLTFFSNTIMNYSLPEVSTQNAMSASITAKIRGTGTVEASEPYEVVIQESRVIASVAVKQGALVEKGDVLFVLENVESVELKEAIKQLEALQQSYETAILNAASSLELVQDVESGKITSTQSRLAQIDAHNRKIDGLQDAIDSYNRRLDEIDAELSKLGAGVVDTSSEQKAVTEAQKNLDNAEAAVSHAKAALDAANGNLEAVYSEVRVAEDQVDGCRQAYDQAAAALSAIAARKAILEEKERQAAQSPTTGGAQNQETGAADETFGAAETSGAEETLDGTEQSTGADETTSGLIAAANGSSAPAMTEEEKTELAILRGDKDQAGSYQQAAQIEAEAKAALEAASQNLVHVQQSHADHIAAAQKAVEDATKKHTDALDHRTSCENKLAEANKNLSNKQNSTPDTSRQDALTNEKIDLNLKISQAASDKSEAETELQELLSTFNMETEWSQLLKQIEEQKEVVAKLRANATDATITAPVSGMVSQLNYIAGQTTTAGAAMAQIVMVEKGYTMSFSVTADQARKISVGDIAEIQNSWYYNDVTAVVIGFKADPSNPQNRLVVFEVTGDVQDGQSLSVSVGQKSATYDVVVPNIAIREDNNGKFVLIVESKSTPLGNRYTATRVDVEVLASDDSMSAVSGGLYGWEYVITNASKPVEAGQLVRLPD